MDDHQTVAPQLTGGVATLSPQQRVTLRSRRRSFAIGALGVVLCLLLLAFLGALGLSGAIAPAALLAGMGLGALWIWLLAPALILWRRAGRDLREGRVATVEGPAIIEAQATPGLIRLPRYRLHISGRSFALGRARFLQAIPGALYRAVYAPNSGVLLDLAPLEQAAGRSVASHGAAEPSAPSPAAPSVALTGQERELLGLIAAGLSNKEIAARMALSVNTVKMYCSQLYRKLEVSRRTEAVARARREGLL